MTGDIVEAAKHICNAIAIIVAAWFLVFLADLWRKR